MHNLTALNCFNNQIDELPSNISGLSKLRHLNLGMNKLNQLPSRFNELKSLEILDLTYNNLSETSVGEHFWDLSPMTKVRKVQNSILNKFQSLRILYLSDNDFGVLPIKIRNFERLEILSLRDNDLVALPDEIEKLSRIHELHLQVSEELKIQQRPTLHQGQSLTHSPAYLLSPARPADWPEESA